MDAELAFNSIEEKGHYNQNNGNVYIPEFGFNGIGEFKWLSISSMKLFMILLFAVFYQFTQLEGCTDCQALNFNQWATTDDGNYDSDGEKLDLRKVGCQDVTACDYNVNATDSGNVILMLQKDF